MGSIGELYQRLFKSLSDRCLIFKRAAQRYFGSFGNMKGRKLVTVGLKEGLTFLIVLKSITVLRKSKASKSGNLPLQALLSPSPKSGPSRWPQVLESTVVPVELLLNVFYNTKEKKRTT